MKVTYSESKDLSMIIFIDNNIKFLSLHLRFHYNYLPHCLGSTLSKHNQYKQCAISLFEVCIFLCIIEYLTDY